MKILYAIQGTGNGHVTRAMEIIPLLQQKGKVDVLLSGIQSDLDLPFKIKYKLKGLSFIFGKKGGVDIYKTYLSLNTKKLLREIKELPVDKYDLVINDFEPVSAWACHNQHIPCIALSHQAALLNKKVPIPDTKDILGNMLLKYYAPSDHQYGFHFEPYDHNIFTPVIRKEIRETDITDKGHYTVYLPSYDDKRIYKRLSHFKDIKWEVFSKHNKKPFTKKNVSFMPLSNEHFVKSMASSGGVICGAGFETPAEALFMNKKLLVIPMKNQLEQHYNNESLKRMEVASIKSLKEKHLPKIEEWIQHGKSINVNYPDRTAAIIDMVVDTHIPINI